MGEECPSGLCLTSETEASICTNRCADATDCLVGEICTPVDGEAVCRRQSTGGGCGVMQARRRPPRPALPISLGLVLFAALGRRFVRKRGVPL